MTDIQIAGEYVRFYEQLVELLIPTVSGVPRMLGITTKTTSTTLCRPR
jgi:hypothetical protein